MLPYLRSQGGGSRCVSLIYHYPHYTYTELPHFQHYSLCVHAESREYVLTNYSYYVIAKNKKDLLLKKVFAIYVWSRFTDSNRRPTVYKTVALTS